MWIDKDGWNHIEDQYDPSTWAEHEDNVAYVDLEATKKYREQQEAK